MAVSDINPTREAYAEIERAYAHFNDTLFDNRLPFCLITFQRQHDTYGYFSARQFVSRDGATQAHEIALNPAYFAVRPIPETLSVLAREMVTLDQQLNSSNKLPRKRYRNKEWADMAEAIGLMPTDTGFPGGKRVGDKIKTYIIDGGPFDQACAQLLDDQFTLSWLDRFPPEEGIAQTLDPESDNLETFEGAKFQATPEGAEDTDGETNTESKALLGLANLEPLTTEDLDQGEDDSFIAPANDSADTTGKDESAIQVTQAQAPPMKVYERMDSESMKDLGLEPKAATRNASKSKFTCTACGANAWGKPSLVLGCYGTAAGLHEVTKMVAQVEG